MKRNLVYMVIVFTIIWIVLREEFTLFTVAAGLVVSTACVIFCRKFLPLEKIGGVNYFQFLLYVIYLMGQMYLGAISAIRLIILGAKADVVDIHTDITNDFLRVMLANSITLVPGSVTLEMKEGRITVMLLHEKAWGEQELSNASDRVKGGLERRLLKSQKRG